MLQQMCHKYILGGYLYERQNISVMSDTSWDYMCRFLVQFYDELPEEFRARVSVEDLGTSSASGLHWTADEERDALKWARELGEMT